MVQARSVPAIDHLQANIVTRCGGDARGSSLAAQDPLPQLASDVTAASDRKQNGHAEVTNRRLAANRRNALKSTGPRTKAGKLAVATKSIGHGIYAIRP
jgi:hypothetical protein